MRIGIDWCPGVPLAALDPLDPWPVVLEAAGAPADAPAPPDWVGLVEAPPPQPASATAMTAPSSAAADSALLAMQAIGAEASRGRGWARWSAGH
jgi:hypothetical protein